MNKSESTNRLIHETSPYLLQHAHNPVEWYPWGSEALQKAKREDKPIFLSIGYSACHWCHVMEHESFEDPETAKIMNEHFVNIKVDREERPDLDHIYMSAVQLITHHGGWPMSVFLTPNLEAFYGGTYFPPVDRMGMPSFTKILLGVAGTWKNKRSEVTRSASELLEALKQIAAPPAQAANQQRVLPWRALTEGAFHRVKKSFDPLYGGLGDAPKFFHTMDMRVALRHWKTAGDQEALDLVAHTLEQWKRGGIYDHLGGGFHRYSTDREWLVPHFEKMLYDNALLVQLYLEAYQASPNIEYAHTVRETLDYVKREMASPTGVFYSTQDADSEGVEGKFYVWEKEEVQKILGADLSQIFCSVYGVSENGNWENHSILNRKKSWSELAGELKILEADLEAALISAKRKLLHVRNSRIAPGRDEKILVGWNGMMIESCALAFQVLGDEHYLTMATDAAKTLLANVWDGKRLSHSFTKDVAMGTAFLDDYAHFVNALITLYESDFSEHWIEAAAEITECLVSQFWDSTHKTFYFTPLEHEKLVLRPLEVHDGATPSSVGMATTALVRLGKLLGNSRFLEIAENALKTHEEQIRTIPNASGQLLIALELLLNDSKEIVLVPPIPYKVEETEEVLQWIRSRFLPNKVVALKKESDSKLSLFHQRTPLGGKMAIYLCQNQTCGLPCSTIHELEKQL